MLQKNLLDFNIKNMNAIPRRAMTYCALLDAVKFDIKH